MKLADFYLIPLWWNHVHGSCAANRRAHMCRAEEGTPHTERYVCHVICLNLGLDFPLSGRVGSQPPQQAMTIQSLKVQLSSCLKQHLKVNLGSGSKATNQIGQSLLCNIKKAGVKRDSPRLIQIHTRKTLFEMETICHISYCVSESFVSQSPYNLNFQKGPWLLHSSLVSLPDDTC